MNKIHLAIISILVLSMPAIAETNFSYYPNIPTNQNTSDSDKSIDADTTYHYVSSTQKDNGNNYWRQDSIITSSDERVTSKTLRNAHNCLAEKNKKLESKVEKLDKKIKDLEYKINMIERNSKP